MRKIYILPNLFTAGSLFTGMLAVFAIFDANPRQACGLIVVSALLDVADGAVARLTRTTSAFGLYLDSLADLVAFGVAPALLAFQAFGDVFPRMASTVCSLFVVCGALRLARFTVQASREERKTFLGLPIPAAALAVTGLIWVLGLNPDLARPDLLARLAPPLMVVVAYLMVSRVIYFSFKQVDLTDRQPFEILVMVVVVASLLFMTRDFLDVVLAVGAWSYVVVGLLATLRRRRRTAWRARHNLARRLSRDRTQSPAPSQHE